VCAAIGIAQYWNLLGINSWLTPLYASEQEVREIMMRLRGGYSLRISGTAGGNANIWGFFLLWHSAFVLASYRGAGKDESPILYLLGFLLLALACAVTQSRSTLGILLVLVVLTIVNGINEDRDGHSFDLRALVLISIIAVASWGLVWWIDHSERRFGNRMAFATRSTQRSVHARIRDFKYPILETFADPLSIPFGRGPSKANLRTDSHNGYTWILQRFGLLGLTLYVGVLASLLKKAYQGVKADKSGLNQVVVLFVFLGTCAWILREFASASFKLPQFMALNLFSGGWLFGEFSQNVASD
jgi:O-antigen ligase